MAAQNSLERVADVKATVGTAPSCCKVLMLFDIARIKQEKNTCLSVELVEEYRGKEEYIKSESKV